MKHIDNYIGVGVRYVGGLPIKCRSRNFLREVTFLCLGNFAGSICKRV